MTSRVTGINIVDADLKNFFGSADQTKLMTLVSQRVSDGRVLRLIETILKSGTWWEGRLLQTERGVPQGGTISPTLSNVLLTPFDRESGVEAGEAAGTHGQ